MFLPLGYIVPGDRGWFVAAEDKQEELLLKAGNKSPQLKQTAEPLKAESTELVAHEDPKAAPPQPAAKAQKSPDNFIGLKSTPEFAA